MIVKNQISRDAALRLFDYRDGMLYWRQPASGQRKDLRAVNFSRRRGKIVAVITIGAIRYKAKYLVWNWHHGETKQAIEQKDGNPENLSIENLIEVAPAPNFISLPSPSVSRAVLTAPVSCPCCRQSVPVPSLDVIVTQFNVSEFQEKILTAMWGARGRLVSKQQLIDAMFSDDINGGPSPQRSSASLKEAMLRLRRNLEGSGITVENGGRNEGYRLRMGETMLRSA